MSGSTRRLITGVVCTATLGLTISAYPVNHYLGSCFTDKWVQQMETRLGVNASERDGLDRKRYPLLRPSLPKAHPRYRVDDPRTAAPDVYNPSCMEASSVFYGSNAQVNANGTIEDRGQVDGSLIVQFDGWGSQSLSSAVFYILAGEMLGYPMAELAPLEYNSMTERMSSNPLGLCNPVHVDMEVWQVGIESLLATYANESYCAGNVGYTGRAGVYTTKALVQDGLNSSKYNPTFSADFWKDYALNEHLINALPVTDLWNNPKYFPPKEAGLCDDGVMGCKANCSRTYACTARLQQGKHCLVVVMGWWGEEGGYIQAMFSNNAIPAYFCFVGNPRYNDYAVDLQSQGKPVLFYSYEPDDIHYLHRGVFERVSLPYPSGEKVGAATGTFGEHGFGEQTDNPVAVDFPIQYLSKFGATLLIKKAPEASTLLNRLTLVQEHLDEMMMKYVTRTGDPEGLNKVYNEVACEWLQDHYDVWSKWIDPLPLCTLEDVVVKCSNHTDSATHSNLSSIQFQWKTPHPEDANAPYTCDGGISSLPATMLSHFSCQQLHRQPMSWFWSRPKCDQSYFKYEVSDCDAKGERRVHYVWRIPQQANQSRSMECDGELPPDDHVDCNYIPFQSRAYIALCVVTTLIAGVLLAAMMVVFRSREAPIIRYGQYEFLEIMLLGGLLMCAFAIVQGGMATTSLCMLRPTLLSLAISCGVGSLLVKAYGTHRLALYRQSQRDAHTVKVRQLCFRRLGLILCVDMVCLACWFVLRPPTPVVVSKEYTIVAIVTTVEELDCRFQSSVIVAVLVFWKALVIVMSLTLPLVSRRSRFDYGESFWLVVASASVVVTTMLCVILTVGIDLAVTTRFVFVQFLELVAVTLPPGFVIVPKLLHLDVTEEAAFSDPIDSTASYSCSKKHGTQRNTNKSQGSSRWMLSSGRYATKSEHKAKDHSNDAHVSPVSEFDPPKRRTSITESVRTTSRHFTKTLREKLTQSQQHNAKVNTNKRVAAYLSNATMEAGSSLK